MKYNILSGEKEITLEEHCIIGSGSLVSKSAPKNAKAMVTNKDEETVNYNKLIE